VKKIKINKVVKVNEMSRAFYSPVKPGGPSKEEGKTGAKTAERALRGSHTNNKSMSILNKTVVEE